MGLVYTEWAFYLYERHASGVDTPIADSTGVVNILTASDPSEVTCYADQNGTAASNPMTFTNGRVRFYTAPSVTSIDISGLTAGGHAFFYQGITPSVHRIVIDPTKMLHKLVIPYQVVGASEAVTDTGFDILANMLVTDIEIHVTTLGTGAQLDVGTSTTPAGFCDNVSVATTGYPATLLEESVGASTSSLFGSLLSYVTGIAARKKHRRANATSGANIVYSNTTSSSTAGEGYIYLTYTRVPTV